MSDICEVHAVFLRNLFVLYLSIDEKIATEGYKIVFAKFLEIFHDDLFPEGYSDFEECLENPNNYELAFDIFANDCFTMVEGADTNPAFKHCAPSYFTLFTQLRKSQRWVKSKKLPFE